MTWRPGQFGIVFMLAAMMLWCGGCATGSKQRSTRITALDLQETVEQMTASLASSSFLANRTPDSPKISIVTRQVENLTTDAGLNDSTRWAAVLEVQAAMPVQELAVQKNIVFQVPRDRIERLRREVGFDDELSPESNPTHVLTAVFRSATRAGAGAKSGMTESRKDYYDLEYQIVNIRTRETVWNETFTFAREATGGLLID